MLPGLWFRLWRWSLIEPSDGTDRRDGQHDRAAQQPVDGADPEDQRGPERGGERPVDRVPDDPDAIGREQRERADPG
jgi:hypothetical protein